MTKYYNIYINGHKIATEEESKAKAMQSLYNQQNAQAELKLAYKVTA